MIIAIMQPTFLPWIGYFAMIDRVDTFVFLDDVQFSRRSWQQRNRIKTANGELMLSLPVATKGQQDQPIMDVEFNRDHHSPEKLLRTITQSYARAPFFADHQEELGRILQAHASHLCDLNIALIDWLSRAFGITTPTMRSSALGAQGAKADRLADICHRLGADQYLSAPGSQEYIEESAAFAQAGVEVKYHQYEHPIYPQIAGPFLPYMAALDVLFNVGPEAGSVIRQGVRP